MGRSIIFAGILLWLGLFQNALVVAFQPMVIATPRNVAESGRLVSSSKVPALTRTASLQLQSTTNKSAQDSSGLDLDVDALIKYGGAIAIQMSLFVASFSALDAVVSASGIELPFPLLVALFYGIALKSRALNPLNNSRPNVQTVNGGAEEGSSKGFGDRIRPSWTPPGFVFPIVWLLIIAPIRAYTSALVYSATGHFADPAIFALMLHLSVGDVWNTINNIERRLGAAATGVAFVYATAAFAAYSYYQVDPFAGKLLAVPLLWFTVASSLVVGTWKLNPNPSTGEPDALYPVVGDTQTEFAWFGGSQAE